MNTVTSVTIALVSGCSGVVGPQTSPEYRQHLYLSPNGAHWMTRANRKGEDMEYNRELTSEELDQRLAEFEQAILEQEAEDLAEILQTLFQ